MYVLKSISAFLSLGLAVSGGLNISSPENDNFRIVVEPTTGAVISIENEGDCNELKVNVNMNSGQSEEMKVDYYISDSCRVENIAGIRIKDPVSPGESHTNLTLPSGSLTAATSCNYIHSSQTVQDVINIDIAKHRLASRRCWNGTSTWMTAANAKSYTGVSWNHAYSPVVTRLDKNKSAISIAKSSGKFHTDWLWCNATSKWQAIELRNINVSTKNGSKSVSFWQSRACPGTHMATASKVSNSSSW